MKKLWFNQTGNSVAGNASLNTSNLWSVANSPITANITLPQQEPMPEEDVYMPDEDMPDMPVGDTIDQFDTSGIIAYSHPFDEAGVPEEINVRVKSPRCKFIRTEIDTLYTKLNYARSQYEIEKIYESIDQMEQILMSQKCY